MAEHAVKGGAASGGGRSSRYVPALDGLRAFAVIAVILYHMRIGCAPGGLMGVTVFFVISGYLINGLLVSEHERTGSISLKGFWLRRVRRLFPAIALSVVGTAALCTLFNPVLLDKMRPDIVPSLLFYNNWWQIFHDVSYFEAAGAPSPLSHFWSLSIEEQFYVVWPLLLLLMYRAGMKRRSIAFAALVLAVLSAVEMGVLYDPMADPSRIYYGTDTRAMSLLLGVWLAFVLPSAAFGTTLKLDDWGRTAVGFGGFAAFGGLLAITVATNGFSSFPYLGGIALTSALTAVLIAALVLPGSLISRLFALPPLVYIGKRSYGMYLWHLPIILLTTNANAAAAPPWWLYLVQFGLILAVSELSYRFVEDPIRKGVIGAWMARRRALKAKRGRHVALRRGRGVPYAAVPGAVFAVLLGIACYGMVAVEPADHAGLYGFSDDAPSASQQGPDEAPAPDQGDGADGAEGAEGAKSYDEAILSRRVNDAGVQILEPLLIGDSVSLGAEGAFYEAFPNGRLDSVVSRNIWESPYEEYLARGEVGDVVVFCLGTNNAVTDWQVDDLLSPVAEDKHVIIVNNRSTTEWLHETNAALAEASKRHANVTLIDWYAASEGHEEYFAGDGTHLTDEGAHAYIALIDAAIRSFYDEGDAG